ncbi:hypothetical protein FHS16_003237 [Paenibacillus endophyticus]|uniref:Uncharacterized protein n=1 Tax=Paenibacillus endophyticus TaxID=1294268 RepID=A0A7W5GAX2_9BACL|nr:hypothetical protein [Paenibacillus endophyticus]
MYFTRKFSFWFSMLSFVICVHDMWTSYHAPLTLFMGVSILYPFKHWMLDFDGLNHAVQSATIDTKIKAYILHVLTFFFVGLLFDRTIKAFKRKWSLR